MQKVNGKKYTYYIATNKEPLNYTIYLVEGCNNEKYIRFSKADISERISQYVHKNKLENQNDSHINNLIGRYGINNIIWTIIDYANTYKEALSLKKQFSLKYEVGDEYNSKDYNYRHETKSLIKEIPDEVKEYILTSSEKDNIKKMAEENFKNFDKSRLYIFYCLYIMRYKLEYCKGQIDDCFTVTRQSVNKWLNKMGWGFTFSESQQLASKTGRRDYNEIRNKKKENALNYFALGSNIEEYIRQKINIELHKLLSDYEVIVGVNNISILENGKEVDVPIVIFGNDKAFKISVEVNGGWWHPEGNEKDKIKENLLKEKGYLTYSIQADKNMNSQKQMQELNDDILNLCNKIKFNIHNLNYKVN